MTRKAVLFSEMTPDTRWEEEFNHWYDIEHIPPRMTAPGFLSAQRYRNVNSPAYLALYELEDKAALATPEYKEIKAQAGESDRRIMADAKDFTRYVAEQIGSWERPDAHNAAGEATFVYAEFFTVPPARAEAFNRWYEQDYIPTLFDCGGWLAVQRFEIVDGEPQPFTHLALHYLATEDALHARQPAQEDWLMAHRAVFRRLGPRFVAVQ